ncbi:preprotein translocase subunit YajC [Streptomyces sp. NRRL S-646]|uniref:preprotein translocase subunit YajC n=1 Tax=Streptomyces sp. NRRL S-646 TaxID=1463917 RepID=UPI00068BD8CC|nr:preprotein translocase subunit YajC [Streptomyces sp. NRRL S-646]
MSAISLSSLPLLLVPLVIPAVVAYFALLRPKRRLARELTALRQGLCVGDRVVTCGGIHATVSGLASGTVQLDVAPGMTHECDREAVIRVLRPEVPR